MAGKLVYSLLDDLACDSRQVALAQALTLDSSRPQMGLSGKFGLFASTEWWENVRTGKIPTERRSGLIQRVYVAGQDHLTIPNEFEMVCDDGELKREGIYVNNPEDATLFSPGARVEIFYAIDQLKTLESAAIVLKLYIA